MGHIVVDWMLPHDFLRAFEGCAQALMVEHGGALICGASSPYLASSSRSRPRIGVGEETFVWRGLMRPS